MISFWDQLTFDMSEGEGVVGRRKCTYSTVRNQNTVTQLRKYIGVKTVADRTCINVFGINIRKDWVVYTTLFILETKWNIIFW